MQILKETNGKALSKIRKMKPTEVISLLKKQNVIGRGGAGFSTAQKWKYTLNAKSETKYVICNADEGEPGTFKDKYIIKNNPKTLIEGIIIAAETVQAKQAFIYLRGEYIYLKTKLERQIKLFLSESKSNVKIEIVSGAGAYICGEETALINSISGRRGQPNYKPPFPAIEGFNEKPTIINNVETFVNVAQALHFKSYNTNLRLFSLSGAIKKPGIYELPIGVKTSDIIKLVIPKGLPKAIYFGCFGGCMKYKDIQITPENIKKEGCMIGTYTLIISNKDSSMIDMAYNISSFFIFESCGKCTPCREGNIIILDILEKMKNKKATREDFEILKELALHIKETSLCGLGQTSTNHIITAIKHFSEEFEEVLKK